MPGNPTARAARILPPEGSEPVQETLRPLRDPRLDLCDVLCQLIMDIRRILVHPDLQNAVKLRAIAEAVDELAPPPPPDWPAGHAAVLD